MSDGGFFRRFRVEIPPKRRNRRKIVADQPETVLSVKKKAEISQKESMSKKDESIEENEKYREAPTSAETEIKLLDFQTQEMNKLRYDKKMDLASTEDKIKRYADAYKKLYDKNDRRLDYLHMKLNEEEQRRSRIAAELVIIERNCRSCIGNLFDKLILIDILPPKPSANRTEVDRTWSGTWLGLTGFTMDSCKYVKPPERTQSLSEVTMKSFNSEENQIDDSEEDEIDDLEPLEHSIASGDISIFENMDLEAASSRSSQSLVPLIKLNKNPAFCGIVRQEILEMVILFQFDAPRTERNLVPGLTGLRNCGNWCFVNACLQPLSNIPTLRDYFRKQEFVSYLNMQNKMGTIGMVSCAFSALQLALWSGIYKCINPFPLIDRVSQCVNRMFGNGRQHDAQEFLGSLIDALHEDVNQVTDPRSIEQNNDDKALDVAGREAWNSAKSFGSSKIYSLIQGQDVSILKCDNCGKESTKFDTFCQITLELPEKSICTLKECLSVHYRKESLRDDAQWNCPNCEKLQNATKTMMLWKLPLILIIHLKRFEQVGATYRKKDTRVDFPLVSLELDDVVHPNSDCKCSPYMLFAVTNHSGSANHGHYTAFCRNPIKGSWFRYDDDEVTLMKEQSVKTSSAYILYYTRVNWFNTQA